MFIADCKWLIVAAAVFLFIRDEPPARAAEAEPYERMRAAGSWAYQLDRLSPQQYASSHYDLLVVDGDVPAATVRTLKRRWGQSDRVVLAYLSIGEAEGYRSYWQASWRKSPPSWLGNENPRWPGNHSIRFWVPAWQKIIFGGQRSQLGRIIQAGFDGVYLDRIDGFESWIGDRPSARAEMIDFVRRLSAWAKAKKRGFAVVAQNAEELLTDQSYRRAIDAVAKEDLLFGVDGEGVRNGAGTVSASVGLLNLIRKEGKPVFAVEYVENERAKDRAAKELQAFGYVPYFAPRALDRPGRGFTSE
jgi:cysteinyl-tRNA synthetase, unknown class